MRPRGWPQCSSVQAPMSRGEMVTCPCAVITFEDSICRASASASPPFTTFSSPGRMGQRQRSAFSVRSRARCSRRYWTRWSWRPRLCVHLEKHKVADPLIEALICIPPKHSVASILGFLKGKSSIWVAQNIANKQRNFVGHKFWARGYFVSTVGINEKVIRAYIENQEKEDKRLDDLFDR